MVRPNRASTVAPVAMGNKVDTLLITEPMGNLHHSPDTAKPHNKDTAVHHRSKAAILHSRADTAPHLLCQGTRNPTFRNWI